MFCCIFKQVKTAIEEIASGKICMSIKKLQLSVEKKDGIISVRKCLPYIFAILISPPYVSLLTIQLVWYFQKNLFISFKVHSKLCTFESYGKIVLNHKFHLRISLQQGTVPFYFNPAKRGQKIIIWSYISQREKKTIFGPFSISSLFS